MKKAYLRDLQSQLLGSVTDAPDALEHFATDASIFRQLPAGVVYPQNTADVRKTIQFVAERSTAGKPLSIVARGKGSDQSGGAVGDGLHLVFPAHMNRLLKLEKDTATVQPGIMFRSLQQTLYTHGRFLPAYPASLDYSTIGGAVANNAGGEKSLKYGVMRDYVKSLKVVLADGSLIETGRISARELNRRKGQSNLEGEIYRKLDSIILDHEDVIAKHQPKTSRNTAGYALGQMRGADGSFDLSQIFIGAQGTLGVITEVTLKTMPYNPRTTLLVGFFNDVRKAGEAVLKLKGLRPSAIELVDQSLLELTREHRPQDLAQLVPSPLPRVVLLIEFDDLSQLQQTVKSKRAERILARLAPSHRVSTDAVEQEALWKLRRGAAAATWMTSGAKKALPFVDDGIVPTDKLATFLDKTTKLLEQYELEGAIWGHAGDGNLHLQPLLDLSKKKDVEKLFDLSRDFAAMVKGLGGSTSAGRNDGLVRAPYLASLYGPEMYGLFEQVKQIFDPNNILNPGKKVGVSEAQARERLRQDYSLRPWYDHLPHS